MKGSSVPQPASGSDRVTLDSLVEFLKSRLIQPVALVPGEARTAFAETETRFNETSWFWTDDNAKAAELLCEPAYYDADPTAADAALDFVLLMSQGEVIRRRGGPAELRVVSSDPAAFRVETAFFFLEGDLTKGEVRQGLRFNDNRTVIAAQHSGHWISFRGFGRRMLLNLHERVRGFSIEQSDRKVVLSFTCAVQTLPLWPGSKSGRALGHVEFVYVVSADSPSFSLTAKLRLLPGIHLKGVMIATVVDKLGIVPGVAYRAIAIRANGSNTFHRALRGRVVLHRGQADYCAIVQEAASPGFSYAVHTVLPDGHRLVDIVARAGPVGRIHRTIHRYAVGDVSDASPVDIGEKRMLTGGGYYDNLEHYIDVIQTDDGAGYLDPSMTYDIGAELNAVAVHLLFAYSGAYKAKPSQERLATLSQWYNRHIQRYFDFIKPGTAGDLYRVFTRGIAFVVLSLDCMLRATGELRYRTMLATLVGIILRLSRQEVQGQDTYITFGDAWGRQIPFLDCQAACILALSRAAWHGDPDGAIGRTIHGAVMSIRLFTGTIDVGNNHLLAHDGMAVVDTTDPARHADPGFWNFKLGLVMRALKAVQRAADRGVLPATPSERLRLSRRLSLAEDLVSASFRRHGAALEVLTSAFANETNSETQPWVALGLVPSVDELIESIGQPGG